MWRSQVVMVSDGRVLAVEPAGRTRPRLRLRFAAAGIAYRTLEAVQEHKANQGGVRGARFRRRSGQHGGAPDFALAWEIEAYATWMVSLWLVGCGPTVPR